MQLKKYILFLFLFSNTCSLFSQDRMQMMETPWTDLVDLNMPLDNYPRPAMVRENWVNLNGMWDYCIQPSQNGLPEKWDGKILVPFPAESYLSGLQEKISGEDALWYRTNFKTLPLRADNRVILHFGAIDWRSEIYFNNKLVCIHEGGYTPISVDITPYLTSENQLLIKVTDPTDEGKQPRGKQVNKPGGIYYTSVTGIWQTAWYEIVPSSYLRSFKVSTDIDASTVSVRPEIYNALRKDKIRISVSLDEEPTVSTVFDVTDDLELLIPDARLWSPDSPMLYDMQIELIRDDQVIDRVASYFGMRKIAFKKDQEGVNRLYLNNKPLFQYGLLDQGFWPDGIYTAPTDEALKWDLQTMKDMGFNMVRKHVKVEPARWYYHADKIGLIVWQDMPSGYKEIVPVKDHHYSIEGDCLDKNYQDCEHTVESEMNFMEEWKGIIDLLYNCPSICVWVPFNESWGQFKTNSVLEWTKNYDPTRLVDGPSGWIDRGEGDLHDYHLYGDRLHELPLEDARPIVIGEFGGLGLLIKDNSYSPDAWSYQNNKTKRDLKKQYKELLQKLAELKKYGFAAAVYTQLTDVETEINGLISYDRKVIKIPAKELKKMHESLIWSNEGEQK